MKLCLEELGHRNLIAKNGSLSGRVLSQHSAKKFTHNSISARKCCKDVRKFACFGTFERK